MNHVTSGLNAFEGLHQALAHLCLRDGRSRKQIAEAAGLNASMLSGYCSGRLNPSLENLDRLLTTLSVTLDDLAAELRMVNHRRALAEPPPPLGFLEHKNSDAAAVRMVRLLLKDLYELMQSEQARVLASVPPEPEPSPPEPAPRPKSRRRGAQTGG